MQILNDVYFVYEQVMLNPIKLVWIMPVLLIPYILLEVFGLCGDLKSGNYRFLNNKRHAVRHLIGFLFLLYSLLSLAPIIIDTEPDILMSMGISFFLYTMTHDFRVQRLDP